MSVGHRFSNFLIHLSTPPTLGASTGGIGQKGEGHRMSITKGKAKKKKHVEKKQLKVGDHVIADTGIKGMIKKITNDFELILEDCSFKVNPISVTKSENF
jgi:hypothetical protein